MKKYKILGAVSALMGLVACSESGTPIKLKGGASLRLADGTPISQTSTDEYNPQVLQMPDGFLVLVFGSDRSCGTCTANTHNIFVTRSVSAYNNDARLPAFNAPTVASPTINLASVVTFAVTKSGSNLRIYYNNVSGNIVSLDVTTAGANLSGPTAIANTTWQQTNLVGIDAVGAKVFGKNANGVYLFDPAGNTPSLVAMATATNADSIMHVNAAFSGIADAYFTLTGGKVSAASYTTAGGDVLSLNTVFSSAKVTVKSLNALHTGVKRGEFIFLSAAEAGVAKQDLYVLDGTTPGNTWDNLATKPPAPAPTGSSPASGLQTTATRVYGQPNFTTANPGSTTSSTFNNPFDVSSDGTGLYVADQSNARALHFPGVATVATRVYGQSGDLACGQSYRQAGGCIAGTIGVQGAIGFSGNTPSVHADANGVYVTDIGGHRVLFFAGTSTTPTRVYGQGGSFTTGNATTTADGLTNPQGVTTDATGVYIGDNGNNRVLFYAGTATTATRVYGQGGIFTTATANNGGISANSLNAPRGIHADGTGLYVADLNNHRVLYYSGTSTTATRVYGQAGASTSATANNGGVSANSLSGPWFVTTNAAGVFISDSGNNRVLFYSGVSTTASTVFGQPNMTGIAANNGGRSANSLSSPLGINASATSLYVADTGNQRVLHYPLQ
jgi:hypothetical protein